MPEPKAAPKAELKSEQEILARFQELRQAVRTIWDKLNDIDAEASEHDLVIKALEPMEPGRRCFRMIGDVLVERSVAETLPAVRRNREGLGAVLAQLQAQLEAAQQELGDFVGRYKIRVGGGGGSGEGPAAAGGSGGGSAGRKPAAAPGAGGGKGVLC